MHWSSPRHTRCSHSPGTTRRAPGWWWCCCWWWLQKLLLLPRVAVLSGGFGDMGKAGFGRTEVQQLPLRLVLLQHCCCCRSLQCPVAGSIAWERQSFGGVKSSSSCSSCCCGWEGQGRGGVDSSLLVLVISSAAFVQSELLCGSASKPTGALSVTSHTCVCVLLVDVPAEVLPL